MDETEHIQIISFYEFKDLRSGGELSMIKENLKQAMLELGVRGTIIIADEGYNGMVCAESDVIAGFLARVEAILQTSLTLKSSFHAKAPFRKIDVKIKREIVTLKR